MLRTDGDSYPHAEGIKALIIGFRELYRIGEGESVVVTAGPCLPWLIAFTKWCLGAPPEIQSGDGKTLLGQSDSRVTLIYSNDMLERFSLNVRIHYNLGRVSDLYTAQAGMYLQTSGMFTVAAYGMQSIRRAHLSSGLGHRALFQALPYALSTTLSSVARRMPHLEVGFEQVQHLTTTPFPDQEVFADALALYLSLNELPSKDLPDGQARLPLKNLHEGQTLSDLPLVRLWQEEQEKTCPRHNSGPLSGSDNDDCASNYFLKNVSKMTADILAISLFHLNFHSLLLYYAFQQPNHLSWTENLSASWTSNHPNHYCNFVGHVFVQRSGHLPRSLREQCIAKKKLT